MENKSGIVELIKSSKILQIGIFFILLSISVAIFSGEKVSVLGLELGSDPIERVEELYDEGEE